MMLSSEYLAIMIMIGEGTIVIVILGDLAVVRGHFVHSNVR